MNLDLDLRPPEPGPKMEFITPRNLDDTPYLVVSRRISAHHVHWLPGGGPRGCTQPCTLKVGNDDQILSRCNYCNKYPKRWKGYLHVIRVGVPIKNVFLCLTPVAGWELMEKLGKDYDLRGRKIYVRRAGKASTTPLIVTIDPTYFRLEGLPPELDPGPFLDTVFRKRPPLSDSI